MSSARVKWRWCSVRRRVETARTAALSDGLSRRSLSDQLGAAEIFGGLGLHPRPRAQLDGRSPLEALGPDWKSDAGSAVIALRLAKELV